MLVLKTKEFDRWISRLKDVRAKAAILSRLKRIQIHGDIVGDWKDVGQGVIELRFDKGPGYRVYLTRIDNRLVVLLVGGSKARQQRDINRAIELAKEWRSEYGGGAFEV